MNNSIYLYYLDVFYALMWLIYRITKDIGLGHMTHGKSRRGQLGPTVV